MLDRRPDLESEIGAGMKLGACCGDRLRPPESVAGADMSVWAGAGGEDGLWWQYARITASQSDMVRPTVHPAVLNRGKHSRIYEPRLLDLPAH